MAPARLAPAPSAPPIPRCIIPTGPDIVETSDYLQKLSKMQHSDYISGYMQLGEPVNQLTSSGVRYTRAPLGARGTATCSMVQICQVNWTIRIPANIFATQLNRCEDQGATPEQLNGRVNFNAKTDPLAASTTNMEQDNQKYYGKNGDGPLNSQHLKFQLAIYARDQAEICSNSLTDLCTNNSVSVSSLESIIAGKRHCGVFIDIPLCEIDKAAAAVTPYFYLIPYDITFIGDFLQDLKVVWLNKSDVMQNNHLAYAMIPTEKPDIVYLLCREADEDPLAYSLYNVRLVNMQNVAADAKLPQKSISQISDAKFEELEIQNAVSGSMQSIMSFANIKALFMTFTMPQYPTCKATKTLYPNKYMLAWKMATDDSFMRGYNSSKIGARTNIQVILNVNLTKGIVDTTQLNPSLNQNDFKHFIGMRSYPDPHQVALTPIMHYLCDAFIRITFDDNPDPQVLSMDVIGEIGGSSIRSG
ncbi:MAG: hypothetical protein EZS28_001353 [Streblomastix strix]|uniref:Uncharacterized protein n=1 Tax=Streblomastix strix TaxID=222440 RepID=A0A5J4X7I1_9EUKA|nr:MAG: hypothetical protein EZS28_001353 [Streblomastix strix]